MARSSDLTLGKRPPAEETIGEYFDFVNHPEKAGMIVRRSDLLAVLTSHHRMMQAQRPLARLGAWLRRYLASSALAPVADAPELQHLTESR
jgi:hypothetical protein